MSHDWITDRLPYASDADSDGEVRVQARPNDQPPDELFRYWDYRLVAPGQKWWSSRAQAKIDAAAGKVVARAQPVERSLTTHQLLSRLNDVASELSRRVREGLI